MPGCPEARGARPEQRDGRANRTEDATVRDKFHHLIVIQHPGFSQIM